MDLTWDLTQLYKSKQEYYLNVQKFKDLCQQELQFKGKLGNKDGLLAFYKLSDKIGILGDALYAYLMFAGDLDGSDAEILEMQEELFTFINNHEQKTLFVDQEIKRISSATLLEWAKLPEFANYKLALKHAAENKKHILPAPQEKLLAQMGQVFNASEVFNTLNDVDIKFGKVKGENGKLVQMTHGNRAALSCSYVRSVRKAASQAALQPYKDHNQTISANYISFVKYCNFVNKASKYKDTLQAATLGSHLPQNLPQSVVKNVSEYLPLLYRYFAWRKKFMGIKDFSVCDALCEMYDSKVSPKYTLQQSIDTIKAALAPLGKDYTDMLDVAASEHWIDSIERPNKRSGAYSMGVYGNHPFILLTFDGMADSVNTIAHEFGHAMHSYYSCKHQPYATHEYGIFLAEIASTVNEILLDKYQIAHAKTKEQKIDKLWRLVDSFFGTVFTQTMYTEFEMYAHGSIAKDEPLTYKKLNDYFDNLYKKYYGKGVKVENYRKYHWCRVPHFYSPFYVYKYATGYIAACAIVQKMLANPSFAKVYKQKFLSVGCSKEPCEILSDIGIDIQDPATYKAGFSLMQNAIEELEELSK